MGFLIIVLAWVPEISTGRQSGRQLMLINKELKARFPMIEMRHFHFSECPHIEEDACPCWRTRPGLIVEAAMTKKLNLDESFFIGCENDHVQMATVAGIRSFFLKRSWLGEVPGGSYSSLEEILDVIDRSNHQHN